jgi:protein-tyrosine phosphatase
MNKVRINFVCLGNICRSPMAEAMFKHYVKQQGTFERFEISSSGTGAYHIGHDADERTNKICERHGIDIKHCAQQFKLSMIHEFDLVIAMDESNRAHLQKMGVNKELHLLCSFEPFAKNLNVPDPYYGNLKDFQEVYDIIQGCLPALYEYALKIKN